LADRLLSVIEKEKNSDIIALLSEAFGSLVEKGKVEREKVEKVASCLLSAIEKEEDSGKRSFLSWVFRSLVEKGKVEREKVEKVASYLLLAIEKEEDSEKLSFLSEAFGSLVEKGKVEREKVEKVASYLLSAIEKEEHSYELSSLSKAFVLLVEKVGKAEAGKLADRLLSAMKKEEDLKRFSCLSRAFILSVEKGKVEREKVEKVASYLLSVIEKEEDFDNLLSLSEDFASLADKVGEAEAGKLADRLLSLIEKEKDSHNLFLSLSKAFSLLGRKEKIEKFVTKILSSIELQEDFYTFLFLLEAFSSLAETGKVEPWEVEKIANKLLLVVDDDLSLLDTDRNIPTALLSVVDKSESKTKQRFFKWLSKFASQRETSRIFNYYVDSEHFSRILQEASEQELVDILKQPFVAGKIQEACLKAFELKFKLEKPEEKFDGNLYKFLKWVKTNKDEKIRKLDLSSPIVN
ncbi:MAG: hypothetical protein JNN15_15190, partial [Blastocatellia bacterium]|nr:hypothetical protein [Blastocatellia bacterium]